MHDSVSLGFLKFIPAYIGGLYLARWADRATITKYSYDDKVIREYMELYPEKFPEYSKYAEYASTIFDNAVMT